MKKIVFSLALLTLGAGAFAQSKIDEVAKFNTETIDLGKVKQNNPTKGTFIVTNIGTTPLIIEEAKPTCGCTISDYTKAPIPPGKTGTINAVYNAAAAGHFDKHLTVKFAGFTDNKSITLTGDVLTAEEYDKWKVENDAKIKAEEAEKAKNSKKATTTKKTTTKKTSTTSTK